HPHILLTRLSSDSGKLSSRLLGFVAVGRTPHDLQPSWRAGRSMGRHPRWKYLPVHGGTECAVFAVWTVLHAVLRRASTQHAVVEHIRPAADRRGDRGVCQLYREHYPARVDESDAEPGDLLPG